MSIGSRPPQFMRRAVAIATASRADERPFAPANASRSRCAFNRLMLKIVSIYLYLRLRLGGVLSLQEPPRPTRYANPIWHRKLDDTLAFTDARRVEEHLASPAVYVVMAHNSPHGAHALAFFGLGHHGGAINAFSELLYIIGVDDQGLGQLPRRAGEARQDQNTKPIVVSCNKLFGNEIYAIVKARHQARIAARNSLKTSS